jgi:hypothetical protein
MVEFTSHLSGYYLPPPCMRCFIFTECSIITILMFPSQPDSDSRRPLAYVHRRRNADPTRDKLILVMRGYRAVEPYCDDECAAGSHCPFARGPNVAVVVPPCSTAARSVCPVGNSCLGREWQYSPPSARVFDVRFMDTLSVTSCLECFEAVHLPQLESRVDYEICTDVTLQGNASCMPKSRFVQICSF